MDYRSNLRKELAELGRVDILRAELAVAGFALGGQCRERCQGQAYYAACLVSGSSVEGFRALRL